MGGGGVQRGSPQVWLPPGLALWRWDGVQWEPASFDGYSDPGLAQSLVEVLGRPCSFLILCSVLTPVDFYCPPPLLPLTARSCWVSDPSFATFVCFQSPVAPSLEFITFYPPSISLPRPLSLLQIGPQPSPGVLVLLSWLPPSLCVFSPLQCPCLLLCARIFLSA